MDHPVEEGSELSMARTSVILGIAGMAMITLQCCSYGLSAFAGVVLGVAGLWIAFNQHGNDLGPASRAYNNVGIGAGATTTVLGLMFSLLWAGYFAYMFFVFALIFGAGL